MLPPLFLWEISMTTLSWTPFDEMLDEALTVIREEFSELLKSCKTHDEVVCGVQEELDSREPDFTKIIAFCLIGEVLRAG